MDAFQIAHAAMHALPIVESPLRPGVFDDAVDLFRSAWRASRFDRAWTA